MPEGGRGRSESGEPAATFPFDPLVGARFLGEIQAEGLRAAGDLVDRLVHLVDGPVSKDPPAEASTEADGPGPAPPQAMGAITPWFDLWADLVQRTTATLQRVRGTAAGPTGEGVQVEVDGSLVPDRPLAVHVAPSGSARSEMWLHNGSSEGYGNLAPRCGPLVTAEGSTLQATVSFEPPSIEALPARSSRGFLVEVSLDDAARGVYRGTVQVRGAPSVWMILEVHVGAGE